MFTRYLKLDLPPRQSTFLWGARKTGKSTFLKQRFPNALYYDLLKTDIAFALAKAPYLFREEVLAAIQGKDNALVIVDEVQKIPALLDEIQWLIENSHTQFILCGSSARKLRKNSVNMLGGRAWRYHFYPLCYIEIPDFDILKAFNRGLIPSHYLSNQANRMLNAYLLDYLTYEIQAESLVRSLPSFHRFIDSLAFNHGELVNYNNIAREVGIDAKTVRSYYEILVDTLLGYFLPPYTKQANRQIISATPKFYLFDVGLANYIQKNRVDELKGIVAGKSLEHFIYMELMAYIGLNQLNLPIYFWRSKAGHEVDFVIDDATWVVEVKISAQPDKRDFAGLEAFCHDYDTKMPVLVCNCDRPRLHTLSHGKQVRVLPWAMFLDELWAGKWIPLVS